uniref:Lipoprotein n=2 Tax=Paracidobacterium acidisoli TaxID=2303751 RepID=A0A372IMV4_9BACT
MLAAGVLLAAVSGCKPDTKPTNDKLQKALNTYFEDRKECLFSGMQFPHEVSLGPGADSAARTEKAQMDAMTKAGMTTVEEERSLKVFRYSLTPAGQRFAPGFCYGHRVVTSVDGFTPAGPHDGFIETTASYHYRMMEVPVWAKDDAVKAAFPEMAKKVSGDATDETVLATAGAGWQVPH